MKYLIKLFLFFSSNLIITFCYGQTVNEKSEIKNYLLTKDGKFIELHPGKTVTSFSKYVHVIGPNKNGKQGEYMKIKKSNVKKIVIRNELHLPLDPNAKRPYIFRIVAKNDEYTLGVTYRMKKSGDSTFYRDYFGIFDNSGNEIVFIKLNRNKKKSVEIIKKYFGDCLNEFLPQTKREMKNSGDLLFTANQIICN
ncbi:hypothetical protein [Aquimarina litoralis]|uniref:hypothetical protein n=1 Tax=Aquimarina litoralis TaxID=584605 RepID=UPI001C5718B1|nr:hypothetical protein [Aquimarina litoralis]MBW1296400.1 hypothetical protein [Aquimarina litoralis]